MTSIRLLLFMVAMSSWPLYRLEIKNAFLHGNLTEEVYMEQPLGFVAQGGGGGGGGLVWYEATSILIWHKAVPSLEPSLATLALWYRSSI